MSDQDKIADLEVRILQRQEDGYPVEITLEGEQEFPSGYLLPQIEAWSPSGDPKVDGEQLFQALFGDTRLRSAWNEARGRAPKRRVRLRIDPKAAKLHALPWELLYEGAAALSAHADTPFSRYLPVALPWRGAIEERPVRLLVVISNPDDLESKYQLAPVEVTREREAFQEAMGAIGGNVLQIDFLDPPVTAERIEEALRKGYHLLHFLGHGAFDPGKGRAALFIQDMEGHTQHMLDDELASLVARQGVQPQLVFLSACQSAKRASTDAFLGLGPKLIAVGVPAVIAMQDQVSIDTAHRFTATFYKRLLESGQVDLAVNEARSALVTASRPDAGVPALFMRLKSGRLWSAEADARGQVLGSKNPRVFWTGLIRMIQEGKCTPIIGPRVHGGWLPSRKEIARIWAEEHGYPFKSKDALELVAQYLASNYGDDFPRSELVSTLLREFTERLPKDLQPDRKFNSLSEMVEAVGWDNLAAGDPNEVHRVLSSLNLPLYLTTNADNLMSESLKSSGRMPVREVCQWNDRMVGTMSVFDEQPNYRLAANTPLVYHLFGIDQQLDSLVLTEDGYLDFLVRISAEPERIPTPIWAALANSSLMFLGFKLNDWDFRVVMRGLVATRQNRLQIKHVAVQLDIEDALVTDMEAVQTFLQQYFQRAEINVFWGSLEQFVAELREQWEAAQA